MKHLITLLLAIVTFVASGQRQTMAEDFKIPYDDMDKVKVDLNLSEEQLTRWNEVNEKYYPSLQALEAVDTLDNRAKMAKARKIIEDRDAELKEFIFAAQWDKYQMQQRKEMREKMKARRQKMMEERKKQMEERKKKNEESDDGGR